MNRPNFSKKLFLSLCLSSVFATSYAGITYNNPDSIGLELTGGWFEAMTQDFGYGILRTNPTTTAVASGNYLKVDPDFKFGGEAALFYNIGCSPYTVKLSYWYFNGDSSSAAGGPEDSIAVTTVPEEFSIDYADAASSDIDFKNHIVNLSLGATFRPDCFFTVTPQVGLTYLYVKNNQNITYFNDDDIGATDVLLVNDKYRGLGPSIGAALDYCIVKYLSLFGNFTYSALVGKISASYNFARFDSEPVDPNEAGAFVNDDTKHMIVGLFQTEIGLSYCFCPAYQGELMVGYAMTKATGASANLVYGADDTNNAFRDHFTDVGFQGPFARISAGFNF